MRNRVLSILLALVATAGMAVAAQRPQHKMGMNVDRQVANLKTRLNLNDQQANQVKALFEKEDQGMHAWRQDNPQATHEAMRVQHQKWMQDREDGLKTILTPEQFKQYQADMEKHRGRMRHRAKSPSQN